MSTRNTTVQNIHLIGIGGAGLSAIATVLLQRENVVSGSDMQASENTERLQAMGATVFIGHHPKNLADALDVIVISSAIGQDNPEVQEARRRGLPVAKRADWLGRMMAGQQGIAIAGTHGKTTTTAMTAYLLQQAGQEPSYIVGGFVPQLNTNAAAGNGPAFVIEADEYDHMFLGLHPQIAVLTIAEWDHPDIFPTPDDLRRAFTKFARLVPPAGLIIGCGDAPGVSAVLQQAAARVETYGFSAENGWRVVELQPNQRGGSSFRLVSPLANPVAVSLALPGRHNALNAVAAIIVAREQGVDLTIAAKILGQFTGVERRFQLKGQTNGITVVDDYAHHPTEIKATLAAARTRFAGQSVWVMFQPHTFSRTLSLLDDFVTAFQDADHVIIVDIFPSREKDEGRVNSGDIVSRMEHADVRYIGPLAEAADYLSTHLSAPAVLLTLGAGDGYQVGEWVLDNIAGEQVLSSK